MFLKSKTLCILCVVAIILAAKETKPLLPVPEELSDKDGCYIQEINNVIPVGDQTAPIGICKKIWCKTKYLEYETCSPSSINDSSRCYATDVDYSRPYPTCCPLIQCDIGPSIDAE